MHHNQRRACAHYTHKLARAWHGTARYGWAVRIACDEGAPFALGEHSAQRSGGHRRLVRREARAVKPSHKQETSKRTNKQTNKKSNKQTNKQTRLREAAERGEGTGKEVDVPAQPIQRRRVFGCTA